MSKRHVKNWLFVIIGLPLWSILVGLMIYIGPDFLFRANNHEQQVALNMDHQQAPAEPFFVKTAQIDLPARYKNMFFQQPYLYACLGLDGMLLLNCKNPAEPTVMRRWRGDELCNPLDIVARDNYFYVADRFKGLMVIDMADRLNPAIVESFATDGIASALHLWRDYLSVACGGAGAAIYDVSEPLKPKLLYRYSDRIDYTTGVRMSDRAVYLADNFAGGFKVLRFENNGLAFQKQYHLDSYCDAVDLVGDRAYVNNRSDGVSIYDISEPLDPKMICRIFRENDAMIDLLVEKNVLLTSYKFFGVAAYDISVETQPKVLGAAQIGDMTETICQVGEHLYVSNDRLGISVFRLKLAQAN